MPEQPIEDIIQALRTIYARLDTLASINVANILIPGGPQERYHEIMEEAYATLGKIETVIDELGSELEYQHKRLDEARDAALAGAIPSLPDTFERAGEAGWEGEKSGKTSSRRREGAQLGE